MVAEPSVIVWRERVRPKEPAKGADHPPRRFGLERDLLFRGGG